MIASDSYTASERANDEYNVEPPTIWLCFLVYIVLEIIFYFTFHLYLKPFTNDFTLRTIKPYRDYGKNRHLLFERILNRMELKCKLENKDMDSEFHNFLKSWFHVPSTNDKAKLSNLTPPAPLVNMKKEPPSHFSIPASQEKKSYSSQSYNLFQRRSTSLSSSDFTLEDIKDDTVASNSHHSEQKGYKLFYKEDLLEFFTWAFFDKRHSDLNESWEKEELNKMFRILESRYGFVYQSYHEARKTQENHIIPVMSGWKPRCMTLEKCDALHRPFALYATFLILRLMGYFILFLKGFHRYHVRIPCKDCRDKYLYYWYRGPKPSKETPHDYLDPILFFHGIAPAGLTFYLPMLFHTIIKNGSNSSKKSYQEENPIFLFENLPITCSLIFNALTEEETIGGVNTILSHHGFMSSQEKNANLKNLILCGHSFGSFQLTWLLKSLAVKDRIKKIILLDPVSILLSEPDVVTNFLYNRDGSKIFFDQSHVGEYSLIEYMNRVKIRVFASSELGIEYYLRRHFAWYNSELWLDDVPKSVDVSIFFAEKDEIINAEKVNREIKRFRNVKLTRWKNLGHGAVLTKSELWFDLFKEIDSTKNN